jgi:hypothetical protein
MKTKQQTLRELSPFVRQYLETALWSTTELYSDTPLDRTFTVRDFTLKAIKQAIADCEAFQRENADALSEYYAKGYSETDAGHDFWLSRNGHGAGFFDHGNEPCFRALQEAARVWGSVNLYPYRRKVYAQ